MASGLAEELEKVHLSEAGLPSELQDDSEGDQSGTVEIPGSVDVESAKKKKKKKKRKPKTKPDTSGLHTETAEQTAKWKGELRKGRPTIQVDPWGLLETSFKIKLDLLLTPGCMSLSLNTPRLTLRPCHASDLEALKRIKLEPLVQRTQLYGSPQPSDIKDSFLNRYVRASIPRLSPLNSKRCRDDYIFAITLKDPSSVTVKCGEALRSASRITTAEGYIGNIALHLKPSLTVRSYNTSLYPTPNKTFTHPTFAIASSSKLTGELFYEIHPQLWGNGIMSEAFSEVLRFAFEEVGVSKIVVDPTEGNVASIKLAEKNGLKYTHTARDNPYRKPQLFHSITREDWWKRNQPNQEVKGTWEGKTVCRWCMNFRLAEPTISCDGCKWAKYCSRECQRADWVWKGGHQSECGGKVS